MGAVKAVTDQTFDRDVLRSAKPVVVDFWATWCSQCRTVDKIIHDLIQTELGDRVDFVKMDIEAGPTVVQRYQVMNLPTVIIFKDGEPVGSIPGGRTKSQFVRTIESAIA